MGNEVGLPKYRTVSPSDGNMSLRLQNNYHLLHFHNIRGENVKLRMNKTVACRHEGFCKGIVFSDRPVAVFEPIYIKFLEISSNWSGALRIGFTMNDPVSMKSKLPRYACPDLTSMQGNWAKAIAERMAKKDSVLYYYVDLNGDVHYGIDSEELGIFFGGVNVSGKLWAVLDIYGNTVAVQFVEPCPRVEEAQDAQDSDVNIENPRPLTDCSSLSLLNLSFHHLHSSNVALKFLGHANSRSISPEQSFRMTHVASRTSDLPCRAYVFTERPLLLNEKVVVRVNNITSHTNGSLYYGITSCNPATILPAEFPLNADDLLDRSEYWVVRHDSSIYKASDCITFSINEEGEMAVMKNDQKSAIFHVDQTQKLWMFFNLCCSISEIELLGSAPKDLDINLQLENLRISDSNFRDEASGTSNQQTFTECVICYEEPVNCALYRCGHVCMCYDCASKMWKPDKNVQCPICREKIYDIIRIYT